MQDQHKQIKGYRDLSAEEITLMNEIKALGPQIEAIIKKVDEHLTDQYVKADEEVGATGNPELERLYYTDPFKWLDVAKLDFQTALMALTRAVAQPASF